MSDPAFDPDDPDEPDFECFYGKGGKPRWRCVCGHEWNAWPFLRRQDCTGCGRYRLYQPQIVREEITQ